MLKLAGNQIGGNLKYREPMLGTVAELLDSCVELHKHRRTPTSEGW